MPRKNKGKTSELRDLPLFAYNENEQKAQDNITFAPVNSANVIYLNKWQVAKKSKVVQSDFISAYMNLAGKIDW